MDWQPPQAGDGRNKTKHSLENICAPLCSLQPRCGSNYSAIGKNETLPFLKTWKELGTRGHYAE